jgi:hypothetical protein
MKLDHIEIIAQNLDALCDFYIRTLDFYVIEDIKLLSPEFDRSIMLERGEAHIELLRPLHPKLYIKSSKKSFGIRLCALEIKNLNDFMAHLKTKNIVVNKDIHELKDSLRAEILDLELNLIELRQWF